MSRQPRRDQNRQEPEIRAITRGALTRLAAAIVYDGHDAEFDIRRGFRSGRLPSESDSWLTITGGELRLFAEALDALSEEPALEHISREALDTALWELTGDLFLAKAEYATPASRRTRIAEFVATLALPWREYEVLATIDHLDVPGDRLTVRGVTYGRLTDAELARWLSRPSSEAYADDIRPYLERTVARLRVGAGDNANAAARAKSAIDGSISVLRYAATNSSRVAIPDVQLLFKRGRHMWLGLVDEPGVWATSGELGFRPVTLALTGNIRSGTDDLIGALQAVEDSPLKKDLKLRVYRAAHWIGTSATRENPDDKLVDLCTAAECFLARKSDGRKGEFIALRSMLLADRMGVGLSDPLVLLDLYERRSQIVHGASMEVCGQQEYRWMQGTVSRLLSLFISFVLRDAPAGFGRFIESIESEGAVTRACDWLASQPHAAGKRMADYVRAARISPD